LGRSIACRQDGQITPATPQYAHTRHAENDDEDGPGVQIDAGVESRVGGVGVKVRMVKASGQVAMEAAGVPAPSSQKESLHEYLGVAPDMVGITVSQT
jgi:hypothetical protein